MVIGSVMVFSFLEEMRDLVIRLFEASAQPTVTMFSDNRSSSPHGQATSLLTFRRTSTRSKYLWESSLRLPGIVTRADAQ